MDETGMTERLDERGLLSDSRQPGVYAVECAVPDLYADVQEAWANSHDVEPVDTLERLTAARQVAYVGASKNVYERLCDHCEGTREASFLGVYPPRRVIGIWPDENPFESEYNRALALVREDWTVWTDGELYG